MAYRGPNRGPQTADWWTKANVRTQIIIAGIQLVVAITACVGIFLTWRFLSLTHYQIELDESAQVILEGGTISELQSGVPLFNLIFGNTGKTPANNGTYKLLMDYLGPAGGDPKIEKTSVNKLLLLIPHDKPSNPLTTLNAGQTRNIPVTFLTPINPNDIQQVYLGNKRIVIYGIFEYTDIFNGTHQNHFCMATQFPAKEDSIRAELMNSMMKSIPTEDKEDEALKKTMMDSLIKLRSKAPQPLAFCLAGND